jgi:hypothetical protein
MERYYQVIIKAPININPGDKVYKFMPGESHSLPEHLGKEIFKDGSPYQAYFSLVDIVPPLNVIDKGPSIQELFKASDAPALNTLSTLSASAPVEKEEVKEEIKEEIKKEEIKKEEVPVKKTK